MVVSLVVVAAAGVGCGPNAPAAGDDAAGDDAPGAPDAADQPGEIDAASGAPDARPPGSAAQPGAACSCDADCADQGDSDGACIYGVCMTMATATCSAAGSQAECPDGSRCWNLTDFEGGSICWPDCSAHSCSATCDGDGSCVPGADDSCDPSCGAACACTETSCGDGMRCVAGGCVPDMPLTGGPGAGPGPACPSLPVRDCTGTTCGQLISFSPRSTAAWDDYPINGETSGNQYRSYLRRDLVMLVSYATSKVACKSAGWTIGGNGGALGLGDMSEANGAIPGTSIGSPGHPASTHTNGFDIDLAYYQTGTANNQLRPICEHVSGGVDQYHCVSAPDSLDVWRHALFLGAVFESTRTRVIGVDGQAGPLLVSAMAQLCDDGWIDPAACGDVALAYETTNENLGWFQFHHHHSHISLKPASLIELPAHGDGACFEAGCGTTVKSLPGRPAGIHRLR